MLPGNAQHTHRPQGGAACLQPCAGWQPSQWAGEASGGTVGVGNAVVVAAAAAGPICESAAAVAVAGLTCVSVAGGAGGDVEL